VQEHGWGAIDVFLITCTPLAGGYAESRQGKNSMQSSGGKSTQLSYLSKNPDTLIENDSSKIILE
jgi:hypothetical protein